MRIAAILVLAVLTLTYGCASVETSNAGGPYMVSIKNSGWKLFTVIPIASGYTQEPNAFSTCPFTDTVNLKNNISMLNATVKETGATGFRHLSSSINEESIFFFLLERRTYHTSAELVFDDAMTK
jgi:hypothetical protein